MQRRRLLRTGGVIGATLLAGCLGGESEEFTLQVADQEIGQDAAGYLVLNVTVSNPGNEPQEGDLYVTASLNGEESVKVREVALDAHETKKITVTYDIEYMNVTDYTPETDIQPRE